MCDALRPYRYRQALTMATGLRVATRVLPTTCQGAAYLPLGPAEALLLLDARLSEAERRAHCTWAMIHHERTGYTEPADMPADWPEVCRAMAVCRMCPPDAVDAWVTRHAALSLAEAVPALAYLAEVPRDVALMALIRYGRRQAVAG